MRVEHLDGKRTGRPRGSRSTPAWVRDLRWAGRHLGDPEAAPPSPLAGRLLAWGREQPDRFLACLAPRDADAAAPPRFEERPAALAGDRPRRVETLAVPLHHLVGQLVGSGPIPAVVNLPRGFAVVGCAIATAVAGGAPQRSLRLTVASAAFAAVPPGAPIPELVPVYGR
jgi:hypothetical protein